MEKSESILCPSSKAQKGAKLLGIRQDDGTIAILPQPLLIDETFFENATKISPAEQRFRFTNKCIESGCKQWTGKRCGVADQIVSVIDVLSTKYELPECGIRSRCRWHMQNGDDACRSCVFVITETTEEEWEMQSSL